MTPDLVLLLVQLAVAAFWLLVLFTILLTLNKNSKRIKAMNAEIDALRKEAATRRNPTSDTHPEDRLDRLEDWAAQVTKFLQSPRQ